MVRSLQGELIVGKTERRRYRNLWLNEGVETLALGAARVTQDTHLSANRAGTTRGRLSSFGHSIAAPDLVET